MGAERIIPGRLAAVLLLGVFALFSATLEAFGGTPPEVPKARTSHVFAPFRFHLGNSGETLFLDPSDAPQCQGYATLRSEIQNDEPNPFSTVTLDHFRQMILNPSGILFLAGHTSTDPAFVFYVEGFSNEADAQARLATYKSGGLIGTNEGGVARIDPGDGGDNGPVWGIRVTPEFISRLQAQQDAFHSLVFANSCDSASELGPAFIDGSDRARILVGLTATCLLSGFRDPDLLNSGYSPARTFFQNMCGASNDAGAYTNLTVSQGVTLINQQHSLPYSIVPSLANPGASQLRLFNAPRLVSVDIHEDLAGDEQFSHQVYNYRFGNAYPFDVDKNGNKDYPGPASLRVADVASKGPLRVILRFSEPMDTSAFAGTLVQIRFANGTAREVTGSWTGAGFPSGDSAIWTGTVDLPDGEAIGGTATLEVRTRKRECAGIFANDTIGLDLDGDGKSAPDTLDTSVSVDIAGGCFLVENEKLIFSRSARENARNRCFGGVHYYETRSRCITAAGLLAGVRV